MLKINLQVLHEQATLQRVLEIVPPSTLLLGLGEGEGLVCEFP